MKFWWVVVDLTEKWKTFLTWVSGADGGDWKSSPIVSNGSKTTCTVANQQMQLFFTFCLDVFVSSFVCLFLHLRPSASGQKEDFAGCRVAGVRGVHFGNDTLSFSCFLERHT